MFLALWVSERGNEFYFYLFSAFSSVFLCQCVGTAQLMQWSLARVLVAFLVCKYDVVSVLTSKTQTSSSNCSKTMSLAAAVGPIPHPAPQIQRGFVHRWPVFIFYFYFLRTPLGCFNSLPYPTKLLIRSQLKLKFFNVKLINFLNKY